MYPGSLMVTDDCAASSCLHMHPGISRVNNSQAKARSSVWISAGEGPQCQRPGLPLRSRGQHLSTVRMGSREGRSVSSYTSTAIVAPLKGPAKKIQRLCQCCMHMRVSQARGW